MCCFDTGSFKHTDVQKVDAVNILWFSSVCMRGRRTHDTVCNHAQPL